MPRLTFEGVFLLLLLWLGQSSDLCLGSGGIQVHLIDPVTLHPVLVAITLVGGTDYPNGKNRVTNWVIYPRKKSLSDRKPNLRMKNGNELCPILARIRNQSIRSYGLFKKKQCFLWIDEPFILVHFYKGALPLIKTPFLIVTSKPEWGRTVFHDCTNKSCKQEKCRISKPHENWLWMWRENNSSLKQSMQSKYLQIEICRLPMISWHIF